MTAGQLWSTDCSQWVKGLRKSICFILWGLKYQYICFCPNCWTWQADKPSDSAPVRRQTKNRCSLSVGKHRAIPNQTPTAHKSPRSAHSSYCSSTHQTHRNYSLRYLGHTHTHARTHLCSQCICVCRLCVFMSFPSASDSSHHLVQVVQDFFCLTGSFHAFFTPALSLGCVQMVYISYCNTHMHARTHAHKEMDRNTFHLLSVQESI